ncbi:MAG: phenylalanine--tRNA ligase subunit beta, partial [Clostridia bacterium]|nr:phenylalanine--tRNA ligase subunit beta [Clostridia bacterium]
SAEAAHSYQHPRNLNRIFCKGVEIGEIGMIHPVVAKKVDKKGILVYAELDVKTLSDIEPDAIKYEEPSKFPGIDIDISFVSEKFAPIGEAVKAAGCPLIKGMDVVDTYRDESGKSITVRIYFAHPEKTLTKDEVMDVVNGIIDDLSSKGIEMKK